MRTRTAVSFLALALFGGGLAMGAEESIEQRMKRFEQRLDEMEAKHKAELKQRDDEIARLKEQIESRRPATVPVGGAADLMKEIDAAGTKGQSPGAAAVAADQAHRQANETARRLVASFNPDIAVIGDFLGTIASSKRSNEALNRFDVREVELDIRAAVHPRADGVAVIAFERDVENPVFPGDEPPEGPESSAGVEEAYLFIHDTGVKGLTAKIGRYHLRFGRQNVLHLHDLPTSDVPLVNQAFLAPEALIDAGVSLSYVVPNPWDQYFEVIGEFITGEGADSESPTLGGDLNVDSPAFNLHALWNVDLAPGTNFELGGSWLRGHADSDNARDVNLFGLDATLLRRDRKGGFNNLMLQGELVYGIVDDPNGDAQQALGAYLLGQQQLNRDWYAGLRLDWTEDPADDAQEAWAVSPYVSWELTEFLRFRVEYQRRGGDVPEENVLYLQATWLFGAHPPHPYWSQK